MDIEFQLPLRRFHYDLPSSPSCVISTAHNLFFGINTALYSADIVSGITTLVHDFSKPITAIVANTLIPLIYIGHADGSLSLLNIPSRSVQKHLNISENLPINKLLYSSVFQSVFHTPGLLFALINSETVLALDPISLTVRIRYNFTSINCVKLANDNSLWLQSGENLFCYTSSNYSAPWFSIALSITGPLTDFLPVILSTPSSSSLPKASDKILHLLIPFRDSALKIFKAKLSANTHESVISSVSITLPEEDEESEESPINAPQPFHCLTLQTLTVSEVVSGYDVKKIELLKQNPLVVACILTPNVSDDTLTSHIVHECKCVILSSISLTPSFTFEINDSSSSSSPPHTPSTSSSTSSPLHFILTSLYQSTLSISLPSGESVLLTLPPRFPSSSHSSSSSCLLSKPSSSSPSPLSRLFSSYTTSNSTNTDSNIIPELELTNPKLLLSAALQRADEIQNTPTFSSSSSSSYLLSSSPSSTSFSRLLTANSVVVKGNRKEEDDDEALPFTHTRKTKSSLIDDSTTHSTMNTSTLMHQGVSNEDQEEASQSEQKSVKDDPADLLLVDTLNAAILRLYFSP